MGTHPIFESDFDCLTESHGCRSARWLVQENVALVRAALLCEQVDEQKPMGPPDAASREAVWRICRRPVFAFTGQASRLAQPQVMAQFKHHHVKRGGTGPVEGVQRHDRQWPANL